VPHEPTAPSAAALFQALWNELVSLVGTPAAAALVRRAVKRASASDVSGWPVVRRQGLEYAYTTPDAWQDPARGDAVEQLRRLVRDDLDPLFRELTGPVIARRLARVPQLVDAGLADEEDR
jgi:hypothetical protein